MPVTTETLIFFLAMGLRLGAAFQWAVLVFWLARAGHGDARVRTLLIFAVSVIGYLLSPLPFAFGAPFAVAFLPLFLAYLTGPMIWLTARALFRDEFTLTWRDFALIATAQALFLTTARDVPTSAWLYALLGPESLATRALHFFMSQSLSIAFALLALRDVREGAEADLVESRLRFRKTFLVGGVSAMLLVTVLELIAKLIPVLHVPVEFVTAPYVLLLGYLLSYQAQTKEAVFRQWGRRAALANLAPVVPMPVAAAVPPPEEPLGVEAREKLAALMDQEKVFVRAGMCLSELARLVGAPEYRLRRHINQTQGYQNFNQYLNFYRVREAKRILEADGGAETPVYNLAMDLGFGGVSSLHRVFKNETGMTPAQYRESCRAKAAKSG